MLHRDQLDIKGRLSIRVIDKGGNTIAENTVDNMIVNSGRALVANLFAGQGGAKAVSHIAIGTDGAPTVAGQAALHKETLRKPIGNIVVESTADDRVRVLLSMDLEADEPPLGAGESTAIQEAGIFNSENVMYNRVFFPTVNKTKDFKLTLFWEIIF